jgi:hypothetical protein
VQYADQPDGASSEGRPQFYRGALPKLSRACAAFKSLRLDAALFLGDIVDTGAEADLARVLAALAPLGQGGGGDPGGDHGGGALTTAQFAALDTTNLKALSVTQVGALSASHIGALTASNFSALVDTQVAALNTTQIKGLTNLRFLDLRGTAVGKLAAEVPTWFEHLEFLGLPPGAVGLFSRMTMPRRVKLAIGLAAD